QPIDYLDEPPDDSVGFAQRYRAITVGLASGYLRRFRFDEAKTTKKNRNYINQLDNAVMRGWRRGKREEFEPDALLSTSNIQEECYFETFLGVTLEDSVHRKNRRWQSLPESRLR
ncbi:hypothetical protein V1477_019247, partial [Vespula maculifrons]